MKSLLSDVEDFKQSLELIYSKVQDDEFKELKKFLRDIEKKPDKYGCVELYEAMVSIPTYQSIHDMLMPDSIVVDCGCGQGIQQVLFKDCYKYIGIDIIPNFRKICDNATFIQGRVEDVLPTLDLPKLEFKSRDVYGISVLCGMCFMNVNKAMKEKFERIIIV